MFELVKGFAKKFWATALFMLLGFLSLIAGIAAASIAEKWSYLGFGVLGFIGFYVFAAIAKFVTIWRLSKAVAKEFEDIKLTDEDEGKN